MCHIFARDRKASLMEHLPVTAIQGTRGQHRHEIGPQGRKDTRARNAPTVIDVSQAAHVSRPLNEEYARPPDDASIPVATIPANQIVGHSPNALHAHFSRRIRNAARPLSLALILLVFRPNKRGREYAGSYRRARAHQCGHVKGRNEAI